MDNRLQKYKARLDQLELKHSTLKRTVEREQAALKEATEECEALADAQRIAQEIAAVIQQRVHAQVSAFATRCLATVFDQPYRVHVEFQQKRGKTEAQLQFIRGDLVLDDPLRQAGIGQVDVAAFGLRVAALVLERPPKARLLVLDEPFKNIRGKKYRQRVQTMIERLADEFGIQFILNIDADAYPEFVLGDVIDVTEYQD